MESKTILTGAAMMLAFMVNSFAATDTWTGGGTPVSGFYYVSTANNWGGTAPNQNTDTLSFAGGSATSLANIYVDGTTYANYSFGGLSFANGLAGPVNISGNAFTLTGTGTANASLTNSDTSSGRNVTINNNITISGSQEWSATNNNAITILNGNLTDSTSSDIIAINGNSSNAAQLPTFQLNGSNNSAYLGTINFETNNSGGILLGSAGAMTGGLIDLTSQTHANLWLTANSSSAPYTFGIAGPTSTGARVNFGGAGIMLTANNSNAGNGSVYWDPGNGSSYAWSGSTDTSIIVGGSNDTLPDMLYLGKTGYQLQISGSNKSFADTAYGNNPGYVTLQSALADGTDTAARTLSSDLDLLVLTQAAVNGSHPLSLSITGNTSSQPQPSLVSISNVNQLPGGNLSLGNADTYQGQLGNGILVLNNVSWTQFTNQETWSSTAGSNTWQISGGGIAARGSSPLVITNGSGGMTVNTFNTSFSLGSSLLNTDGTQYANQSINLGQNTTFTAGSTPIIEAAGNSTVNLTTGAYTLGTQVMTLSGVLQSSSGTAASITFAGGEGYNNNSTSYIPIVLLNNSGNGNSGSNPLNITTGAAGKGSGFGILEATSDAVFGGGTLTIDSNTPGGASVGWEVLLGGYSSSKAMLYTTTAAVTGATWGLGSYTGSTIYTGDTTINVSNVATEVIPFSLDAESGSTFQLGTGTGSGTTATFTNSSATGNTIQYRKTGAGTTILQNVTYNGSNTSVVQFNIQNGALQETGNTAVTSADSNSTIGAAITLNGGVLETNNTNESSGFQRSLSTTLSSSNINMTGGGGFSAYGGALTVALGGTGSPTAITWGTTSGFVASTNTLVFGSQTANNVVTFQNAINLNAGVRNIQVVGTGTSNEAVITGAITGTTGSGINLTGSGDLLVSNTNSYVGATNVNGGTLLVNGSTGGTTSTATTTVASGAAVGGTGTINGAVIINAGGGINLHGSTSGTTIGTPVIGTLTVGSLTLNNTTSAPALTFDITSGGTSLNNGNLDQIVDNGALTLGGTNGITINVNNLTGSLTTGTTLATGTYTLLSYASGTQLTGTQAGYFSLSSSTLDGDNISLYNGTKALELVIGANVTTGTYTMATTAGGGSSARILVSTSGESTGTSTALSTTLNNTGSSSSSPPADSINVTGLGASSSPSTSAGVTGSTAGSNTNVADSGSLTNSSQTFSSATTGTYTISPTVSTATGASGTGAATDTGTTTASVVVVNERTFSTSTGTLALGRVMINTAQTGTVTVSSTGLNGTTATGTLGTVSASATDGLSLGTSNSLTYNGSSSSQTDTFTLSGSTGATTGTISGSFSSTPTDEFGNSLTPVTVALTGDAVAKRTITNGASTSLGVLHNGATVSGTANAFSSTGTNTTTTSVQVLGGSGSADGNGVTLTGSTSSFTGATSGSVNGSTQTFGGTITNGSGGTTSGTFSLAATTLENGGSGLAGEGSYSPVSVAYSAYVYTGTGVWNTAGGGAWGTSQTSNQASTNWQINGGTPGISGAPFLTTDSASFGNTGFSGTATVTLGTASPYLNAITFNDGAASYDIEQGGTGTIHLDSTGTATVTVSAGSHIIGAPIELDSASATSVASTDTLTINGIISQSGTRALTIGGAGTTVLNGSNSYGGTTTVNAGSTLLVGNGSGSATGSGVLSVAAGATLGGTGIINGSSFTIGASGTAAKVIVGNGTDTTSGMTLEGSGSNSITNTTLAFNISAATAGQGNELSVGTSAIAFSSSTLALNVSGTGVISAYTPYVLIAGTGTNQYSGLTTQEMNEGGNMFDVITAGLSLSFSPSLANTWYAGHSFLYLNTTGGVDDIEVVVVPEPGTWALMLGGLAMLIFWQRRRQNSGK